MSLRATLWALYDAPTTDPTAKLVLLVLADHAGDDGRDAFPSVAKIARAAGVTERTVQRHLRDLEAAGLIVKGDGEKAGRAIKRSGYIPTTYDLQMRHTKDSDEAPRGDAHDTTARGDNMTPLADGGVTPVSPHDAGGVTPVAGRGDTGVAGGVTPVSPEPKDEPREEPKRSAPQADALDDDEIRELNTLPSDKTLAKRWAEMKGHAAATAWHDKLKAEGVKIMNGSRAFHALRTMITAALFAGYSRGQVWTALTTLGKPLPSQPEWDRTLRILDSKVGNVNDGWTDDHTPPEA